MEDLDFSSGEELEVVPLTDADDDDDSIDVRSQTNVQLEEIPLIAENPEVATALRDFEERGGTPEELIRTLAELKPVPVTRARMRQAKRFNLDMRVRTEVGRIVNERGINPQGHDLDRQGRGRTNFVVIKSAIDRQVNVVVGRRSGERHEFTREELDNIANNFSKIVERCLLEVFDGTN